MVIETFVFALRLLLLSAFGVRRPGGDFYSFD